MLDVSAIELSNVIDVALSVAVGVRTFAAEFQCAKGRKSERANVSSDFYYALSLFHSLQMLRTHTCGELRLAVDNKTATLTGWVQTIRDKGGVLWIDLRDRYGITQLLLEDGQTTPELFTVARSLGREFVVKATGTVIERKSKNPNIPTGDIELKVTALDVLNPAKLPPFLIEDNTDGAMTSA